MYSTGLGVRPALMLDSSHSDSFSRCSVASANRFRQAADPGRPFHLGDQSVALVQRKLGCDLVDDCDQVHRELVNLAEVSDGERGLAGPLTGLDSLAIDPICGVAVPLHLHVLTQLLVTHGPAFFQELLNLVENQCVALDRRRVMRLFEPDPEPA
jgi:hypothetical protein